MVRGGVRVQNVPAGVGVLASVGHADEARGVDVAEVLVLKRAAVYGLPSRAVAVRDVAAFNQNSVYQAVKGRRPVGQGRFVSHTKRSKAATCQRFGKNGFRQRTSRSLSVLRRQTARWADGLRARRRCSRREILGTLANPEPWQRCWHAMYSSDVGRVGSVLERSA